MAFSFDQIFAADPSNPSNVAQNASITIFAPGDATMAPLTITDPDGQPLANPIPVNANGFGSAFAHATLDRVAWAGGGFTGFFTSYEGMKGEAVAAREAAEAAAATAGAEAAVVATAAIGTATDEAAAAAASAATAASNALSSATAAANSAALVGAPADTAIAAAINGTGATKTALDATFPTKAASPRDTARLKLERKPVFLIDQIAPNANYSHKIVWAEGDTLWSYGQDFSLRKSTDKGRTWGAALSSSLGTATWAKYDMFYKTAAGSLITTSHPADASAPKIIRSVDGITWADVIPAKASVEYLGVTNICQDPVTGYLYIAEYVTVNAATKATWAILRSTDDGVTWTTFHTFQRDAAAYPTTAVRHGHAVQWDPVSQRIYFLTGDAEPAAGIYRVNAAGTGIEKVVLNGETTGSNMATAVGIMFFPNYIAWGMDQTSDSWLLRMNRNQIGVAVPSSVEKIGRVQSTAWYTCRVAADGTEWLMTVSNETSVGRVDAAAHVYRVADDAATLDEVLTVPTPNDSTFSRAHPIGTPLQTGANAGYVWLGTNTQMPFTSSGNLARGQQFAGIIGWGGQALQQTASVRLPYTAPVSQSSGSVSLAASELRVFGVTEAPIGATRLYIIDAGVQGYSGTGLPYLSIINNATGLKIKLEDGTTDMFWQNRSLRSAKNQGTAPYVYRSVLLGPGVQVRFRIDEVLAATVTGSAYVTYAWGF